MKKIILAILIFIFVLGIVSFVRLSVPKNTQAIDSISGELSSDISAIPVEGNSKITAVELSSHSEQSDCWVAYDGKVYDVTSFLPRHPGSAGAISPFCGTSSEFTEAFTNQHGTSKVGNLMRVAALIGDFDIVGEI